MVGFFLDARVHAWLLNGMWDNLIRIDYDFFIPNNHSNIYENELYMIYYVQTTYFPLITKTKFIVTQKHYHYIPKWY